MATKKIDTLNATIRPIGTKLETKVGSQTGDDLMLLVSMAINMLPWYQKKKMFNRPDYAYLT